MSGLHCPNEQEVMMRNGVGWFNLWPLSGLVASMIMGGASGAEGADFYVDPETVSADGDGSASSPWESLQQVLDDGLVESTAPAELPYDGTGDLVAKNSDAPVKGGDTIWLETGDYGDLTIENFYNEEWVTLHAADGASARFTSVLVRGSAKWRLVGLEVSAEFADTYTQHTLVNLDSHAHRGPVHDIEIADCRLSSVADASGWSAEEWDTLSCNGIQVDGSDNIIRNNTLSNVDFGISVSASNSLVERNVIDGFAGDGLRGLGDYNVFQYNTVKNCYDVNENHDDGFQSWSVGDDGVGTGEVVGVVLRGNLIINYEDPNQPFRGTLQGIGCFDGMFVDWVVENNVVITDHWHGITLLGARGSRVVNNTVMDINDESPGPPWISIDAHKDDTAPVDCLVRNNLTTTVNSHEDVTVDNNLIIEDPSALFVDPEGFDLRLLPTAEAIDIGEAELAPELDADGIPRPQGEGVDVGAYEWHEDIVDTEQPDTGTADIDVDTDTDNEDTDTTAADTEPSGTGGDTETGDNAGTESTDSDSETESDGGAAGNKSSDDSSCGCRLVGHPAGSSNYLGLLNIF
jgi:parallel beta-helix repeat protein